MTEPSARGHAARARRLLWISAGLVALQLLIRGWVSFSGFFSLDDYVFYTRAGTSSLNDVSFLFADYNGHLMPGSMIWVWLTTELAPLDFAPIVIVGLILQLAVDVAMFLVLRRLFGSRYAILVPFAVFLFTTLTLPGLVWWAAALNQLPQQLFMLLAVLGHLRFLRTEHRRDGFLAPLAIVGGLAFSEKTLLAIPLLFVVTWFFFVGPVSLKGVVATLRSYRSTWLVHVTLAACYVVVYATQVDSPVRGGLSADQAVTTVDVAVRRTIIPGMFGGPWSWKPLGTVDSLAAPHPIAQLVAVLAFGALVAYSLALSRSAWRGWALLGLAVVAELALLLLTRVQVVGAEAVAAEYRYFTDLGLVTALGIGFAFFAVTAPVRRPPPKLLEAPPLFPGLQSHVAAISQPALAITSVTVVLIGSIYSAGTYRDRWSANPGSGYFAQALPDLRALPKSSSVYDGAVPSDVVWRLLWPATLPSRLVAPTGIEMKSLEVGESTTDLVDIGASGKVESSEVSGIASVAGKGPCGWAIDETTTSIPLDETAFYWNWVIEIRYSAAVDTTIQVEAGETTSTVLLPANDDVVYVAVEGEIDSVELRSLGAQVCVSSLVVGLPQPVEW